ncbi:hypothetical protein AGOR_G00026760 [Albula goreensis]|uniref:Uncharacterized protein n=1 Tax=Albula goreensis TaxID=1534307 RepID=A0A8T3E6W8_9TELE|nr:hypothetical protein AGOR_G00026760 [Albula goreensis]
MPCLLRLPLPLRSNPQGDRSMSLTRSCSLRSTPAPTPSALPTSQSLNSALQAFPGDSIQLLPPVPPRSKSQETLRASPNPFLSANQSASTNPFTGKMAVTQRRSLTPELYTQQQTLSSKPHLQRAMSAFAKAPLPGLAPPPAQAKRVQQWVTFDEDLNLPTPGRIPAAANPVLPKTALTATPTDPQTLFPSSGFDSSSWGAPSTSTFPANPPPVPSRTNPGIPQIPPRPSSSFLASKEFTER